MNDITTPDQSSEKSASKCPLSSIRDLFKSALDSIVPSKRKAQKLQPFAKETLDGLQKVDFQGCIAALKLTPDLRVLQSFFGSTINRILNLDESDNIGQLIGIAIIEIYCLLILNKSYGLDKGELLGLIPESMAGAMKKEIEGKNHQIGIQYLMYEAIFEHNLNKEKIIPYIEGSIKKYRVSRRRCPYNSAREEQKEEFILGIWEILEVEFLPALQEAYKDKKNLNKEEIFYLGKFKEVKDIVIERAGIEMMSFLEGVDFDEFLGHCESDFITIPDLEVDQGLIEGWIQDLLSSFVNEEGIIQDGEMQILMQQKETSIEKNIINVVLLGPLKESFMDIYNVYLLHHNFGIDKGICKRFLHMGMIDGLGLEQISEEINESTLTKTQAESVIKDSLDIQTGSHVCPFFKIKYKKPWINSMWDIIRDDFLPTLQKQVPKYKENLSEKELFYLGIIDKR